MFDKSLEIPIGSDHAGYEMKQYLIRHLTDEGYILIDFGTHATNNVDYPDFIHPVAKRVQDEKNKFAVIICGSGQGANMTANKYLKVRSALTWDIEQAKLSRLHNDANIIALPGRFVNFEEALKMVKVFLDTEFEGGRHKPRVEKISHLLK